MHRTVAYRVCRQAGATGSSPLVVGLHGRGGNDESIMALGVPEMLAERTDHTKTPITVVTVDGGDHSYYHRRTDGTDAGRMVWGELVPLLRRQGLAGRLGLYGYSMGGYGAMLIASRHPALVHAVAVSSPALWLSASQTPDGAFDSADDYEDNSVWNTRATWKRIPLSVSCGTSDSFCAATKKFVAEVDPAQSHFGPGNHDASYWAANLPSQLSFLAA